VGCHFVRLVRDLSLFGRHRGTVALSIPGFFELAGGTRTVCDMLDHQVVGPPADRKCSGCPCFVHLRTRDCGSNLLSRAFHFSGTQAGAFCTERARHRPVFPAFCAPLLCIGRQTPQRLTRKSAAPIAEQAGSDGSRSPTRLVHVT